MGKLGREYVDFMKTGTSYLQTGKGRSNPCSIWARPSAKLSLYP